MVEVYKPIPFTKIGHDTSCLGNILTHTGEKEPPEAQASARVEKRFPSRWHDTHFIVKTNTWMSMDVKEACHGYT